MPAPTWLIQSTAATIRLNHPGQSPGLPFLFLPHPAKGLHPGGWDIPLDSTLVVWGGEFGRTPQSEKGDGRDHNPSGFTMWMAGGGVKGGQTIGTPDELGLLAVDQRLHVHDLHATILEALGLDNMDLVYKYKSRPERPTLNEGGPCAQLF